MSEEEIVAETENTIEICVGEAVWVNAKGMMFLEEDFKVSGEVWRIHKSDADPLPSDPHAHCIGGAKRFVGCKLHFGTRELFSAKNDPLGRYLGESQFDRLIQLATKKFPDVPLPIPPEENPN